MNYIINNWSKISKPNPNIRYDHIILETPIGKLTIEWKSWKEKPSYDIMLDELWIGVEYSLDDAKTNAISYISKIYYDLKVFLNE